MSKLVVTFTFTDSVEVNLADYVDLNMSDARVIGIARDLLARNYDGHLSIHGNSPLNGAYLLLGDAEADIELADIESI